MQKYELKPFIHNRHCHRSDAGLKIVNDDDVTAEQPMDKVDKRMRLKSNNSL
jgi:hypothetical protein